MLATVTTNATANSTANATSSKTTLAESNSTTSANASTSANVTANSTSVAQKATATPAETSDDWDTDIVQTKETKTVAPVPVAQQTEFTGPTDIDDLTLKTQIKSNETIIVTK
jgi:hypothetical protein